MFALDSAIDTIQTGKKMFVSTFVTNETMAKAMNNFVDAQTEYTKKALKTTADAAMTMTEETAKTVEKFVKFDYTKILDTFSTATKK
jgi:hypothetical protein